jgi:hypothetical protein
MSASDDRPTPDAPSTGWPLAPTPGRAARATTHGDAVDTDAPLKQEGDALLDGSGSRQGLDPDPTRDAAPHE